MDQQMMTFTLERETKNMVRYAEIEEFDIIGTLYVSKEFLGERPPKKLTVTVVNARVTDPKWYWSRRDMNAVPFPLMNGCTGVLLYNSTE